MEFRKFGNNFVVRVDKGEEIVESLKLFCKKKKILLGSITGIGATNKATIGLFEPQTKKYVSKELEGNFEISPLSGNISTMDGKTYLHLHINLCDSEQKCFGGHLNSAIVSATFEATITAIGGKINRKFSKEIGLNLLEL